MNVKPIPDGYHTLTPYLVLEGAADFIDFAVKGLGAEEKFRMAAGEGKIAHAELRIGDSTLMVADASPQYPLRTVMLHAYVADADASYRRALQAGAVSTREPSDQFYGDRTAGVKDRWGNDWYFATHKEDVSPEEMQRRAAQRK
jgi:PhnB protein